MKAVALTGSRSMSLLDLRDDATVGAFASLALGALAAAKRWCRPMPEHRIASWTLDETASFGLTRDGDFLDYAGALTSGFSAPIAA